jgi:hypothetical protein
MNFNFSPYRMQIQKVLKVLSIALFFILLIGCEKEKDSLPIYGKINWTIKSDSFKADSFAVAERVKLGWNRGPRVSIYGYASNNTSIQISIDPINGVGNYTVGGPNFNINTMYLRYSGKEYRVDNNANATSVIINLTEESENKIKGDFQGELITDSGQKIPLGGSFDMNF